MGHTVKTKPDPYYRGVSNYVQPCPRCGVRQLYMQKLSVSERVDGILRPIFTGYCRNCDYHQSLLEGELALFEIPLPSERERAVGIVMYLGGAVTADAPG